MKKFFALIIVFLFSVIASQSTAQKQGDIGSPECREVQLAVQDAVLSEGLYKNHGQMMRTVTHLVNEEKKAGRITGRCAACIKKQFAQRIPSNEQELCGTDPIALEVLNFATNTFKKIRNVVAPEDETKPEAEFIGHHIEVSSEKWVYVLDDSGQQIFRPRAMYPHIEPSLSKDITPFLDKWMKMTVSQNTVDEATRLAMETIDANYKENVPVNVVTRRELIALKDLNLDTPLKYYEGRTKVLFSPEISDDLMVKRIKTEFTYNPTNGRPIINVEEIDMPPRSHETAITFAQERIVRVDSVFLSPEAQKVVDVFREGLMKGYIKVPYHYYDQMVLGTFFSPNEWRFQFSAYSWESEDFITNSEPYCEDSLTPYGTGLFPYCADDPALMDFFSFFRLTDNYRKDYWYHWNLYGRTNGIRGNCKVLQWPSQTCEDWEIDNWVVRHHNLREYGWVCPADSPQSCIRSDLIWPDCCYKEPWIFCTDFNSIYDAGAGYILEDIFYNDLEDTQVAMINAHGGPAYGISHYQIQSQRDIWTYIHTAGLDGLGKGKLRHLFLASCASMNWHKEEPYYLETDWLNNHVADGIRSIFGTDGAYVGTNVDGLIFFSFYNNGDSVSDSWANMEITITSDNVPVGIGYGSNPFAALASLLDDRFSKTRTGNNVAAVLTLVP